VVSVHANEALLFSILAQLIVMIGAARALHVAFRAMGQPGVIGEIVAGLMLGPSLFGHLFPDAATALFGAKASPPIGMLSQIGLILLMFQIGADFEFGHLRDGRLKRAVGLIASGSIAVPFALGLWLGLASADSVAPGIARLPYALFCGVALAITAVPILGRILREFGLTASPIGVVAISAAAINDVVGWVMLACISAYATATLDAGFLLGRLAAIAALLLALRYGLAPLVDRLLRRYPVEDGRLPLHRAAHQSARFGRSRHAVAGGGAAARGGGQDRAGVPRRARGGLRCQRVRDPRQPDEHPRADGADRAQHRPRSRLPAAIDVHDAGGDGGGDDADDRAAAAYPSAARRDRGDARAGGLIPLAAGMR
jgi:hypothetical protein